MSKKKKPLKRQPKLPPLDCYGVDARNGNKRGKIAFRVNPKDIPDWGWID